MKERQLRSSDAVTSISFCHWSWHSHGSLIPGKFDLKINRSIETPRHEYSGVTCSYSSTCGCGIYLPILILSIEFLSEKRKCYIGKLDTLQAYALVDCVGFLVLLITKKVAKRFIFLFFI